MPGQRDLDFGVADDALVLALPARRRIGAHLFCRAIGRGDYLARLVTCLFEHVPTLVVGGLCVSACLVGGFQGLPDLLLALLQRFVDGRKHVLVDQEEQYQRDDQFDEERPIGQKEDACCGGHGVLNFRNVSVR